MTRILLVEDEASFSEPLSYLLAKEGYEVSVAETGPEAVTRFVANGADLVLLDLMLPGMSGIDVCRVLRSRSSVPIIMLTAKDSEIDKVVGLELGADDYVTKPYSSRELIARIRAVLRRNAEPVLVDDDVLEVGDLRLDPAARRVWRGDSEVSLSAKEFQLLETFMRHPGEVLSRYQLLEHAWDYDYENRSNIVDVYVRYLRDKIDRPFGRSSLETVRGAGYRLDVRVPAVAA